jgi:hypothetical protein
MSGIGSTRWAIAGGHVPLRSHGPEPLATSCDELCVLNTGERDAQLRLTVYYEDRAPAGPYELGVEAQRVRHVRLNDLIDPEPLPLDTPYAAIVEADVPVVVQFSRRDTSQAENAIATTLAFAVPGS